VRHLRLVDLAKTRCDLLALVELVKHSGHIGSRSRWRWGWRDARWRGRGRDAARDVESRNRRRGRRRRSSATSCWRATLDFFQSVQRTETRFVVPSQALRIVLLEIGREGLEVLVVRLDVLNVRSVPANMSATGVYLYLANCLTSPCTP
jgi:hypothetical protein